MKKQYLSSEDKDWKAMQDQEADFLKQEWLKDQDELEGEI